MSAEDIHFYSVRDPFGCFSNFSPHPVMLDGKLWPTSEHYFQAQKFVNAEDQELVRRAPTPMEAARLGLSRNRPIRTDWDAIRDAVMEKVVEAKFLQHKDLRDILLSTGDARLVEHTRNDSYWADGGDGTGKNRLGAILMTLRTVLRQRSL